MFRFVFITLVALIYYYLGNRLTEYADLSAWATYSIWAWLFLVFGFFLVLPFYFWHPHRNELGRNWKRMMRFSHQVMAYLNFLLPFVMIRDLVGLVAWVVLSHDMKWIYSAQASLALLALPFAFKAWGAGVIARGPRIIRKEVGDSRLSEEFSGLRIVQISDLHISHFLKEGFVDHVVEKTMKLNPDVIVMTGDIVDGPAEEFAMEIAKLKGLKAPRGVFFVPGNHEYYWGFQKIEKHLQAAGIVTLKNETSSLRGQNSEVLIAGVPDPAASHFGDEAPKIENISMKFSENQYRILLSHQPNMADQASAAGFHFQFSGHTHGGQFFPWNLLIGFFQKYPKGLFRIGEMHLYVNQGTGYWGPALRVGTHCEMTEIILRSKIA